MPHRSTIYYGRTMEKLIEPKALYRIARINIPTPEFYVFFNGKGPQPLEQTLYLSHSYLEKTETPMLELKVKVININLNGIFLTDIAAGKYMLEHGGGSIINTASMSAHIVNVPQPQCAYNASKAGVIQLTKSLAIEWAKRGVRVNSISPGYIGTELTLNSPTLVPLIEKWNIMAPIGRMGTPEELESICVYLAGDTSTFTTGSDFIIDGAFTCF